MNRNSELDKQKRQLSIQRYHDIFHPHLYGDDNGFSSQIPEWTQVSKPLLQHNRHADYCCLPPMISIQRITLSAPVSTKFGT